MISPEAYECVMKSIELAKTVGGPDGLNAVAELDMRIPVILKTEKRCEANATKQNEMAGPLCGIPILVKDNIDVKGIHTTAGSLALSDNIASEDAPIIKNLRRNGAVIIGKTNMTEFANFTTSGMPAGYSSRGGQVIHAANPELSPSGSSSGSGVAVAAGIVPMAVGTDTSFSVIVCARENGICGLKPPVGALHSEGIIPIARTLDSAGAMANNFTDALKLYSAMRDEVLPKVSAADIKSLKIAVNTANSDMNSDEYTDFLKRTVQMLKENGAEVSELQQPPIMEQIVIMTWEFREQLEDYLKTSNASRKTLREIVDCYEANPDTMMRYGDSLLRDALDNTPGGTSGEPYLKVMRERETTIVKVKDELKDFDAVIMTGPTNIMHFCGFPSVNIAGSERDKNGVRRGIILYGIDEMRLYRAALAIEGFI